MHAAEKYSHSLIKPAIGEQINKIYMLSYLPGHRELKFFIFIFIVQRVRMSCTFVYNMVNLNKIDTIPLAKLPPYVSHKLTLGWFIAYLIF